MPYASFVWSFGLLYIHSAEPIDIELGLGNVSCRCLNLTIGEKDSDLIIGNALGNMTKLIAMKDSRYNTSQWCYMRKMPQQRSYIPVDIKFFKTKPSLEYICCAYNEAAEEWSKMFSKTRVQICLVGHSPNARNSDAPLFSSFIHEAERKNSQKDYNILSTE